MSRAAGAPSVSSLSSLCLSPTATVLDAAIRDFRDSRRHRLLLDRIRRPEPALVEGEQRCLFDIESVNNNLVDNNLRFREVSYCVLDAVIRDFRDSRRHRLLLDRLLDRIRRPEPALVEGEQRCPLDIESVNNNLVNNNLRFRKLER